MAARPFHPAMMLYAKAQKIAEPVTVYGTAILAWWTHATAQQQVALAIGVFTAIYTAARAGVAVFDLVERFKKRKAEKDSENP